MSGLGFVPTILSIAVLLSVIVRWIRSGVAWGAIEEGHATSEHLQEVTGITDRERLQESFGAPRLEDGVFPHVTRREALRHRTPLGYLLGDPWLDGGSALLAVIALAPVWPLWVVRPWVEPLVILAALYQLGGWAAATRLPGKR